MPLTHAARRLPIAAVIAGSGCFAKLATDDLEREVDYSRCPLAGYLKQLKEEWTLTSGRRLHTFLRRRFVSG